MKKDLTLVIMAAGMGSRFGGLKQIEPVGPNGEFIIDYSIYDAIRLGFNKVVFIIKEENYEVFKETIGKRIEKQIKVEYAFQRQNDIPAGFEVPEGRVKPWGTSHAILAAKNYVNEDFLVLNADDFYGYDAFKEAKNFFLTKHEGLEYAIIGYHIKNTLTDNGSVKRGICEVKDGYLSKLVECSVEEKDGVITASPLDGSKSFNLDAEAPVSMNMFCFTKDIFGYLEKNLEKFFESNKDNLLKCEYLLPDSVNQSILENIAKVKVIPTSAVWQGMTYKEDKEKLVKEIAKLIKEGVYPENLWK